MSTDIVFTPKEALQRLIEHREIFHEEMTSLMRQIMSGEVSSVMIAAILLGLRVKKESIEEIAAAAAVMREFATKVPVNDADSLLDIVGTGGDGAHTFNISTTVMFVAAAAGAKVAKHGGRSVSSQSGDVPMLLNCTAGKDRTGVAIALLLELAGVSREVIVDDYMRSKVFGENLVKAGELEPGMMASFGFMPSPGQVDALIGVRPDYLEAAWEELARGWSDVPGYFAAAGLDEAMQRRIRALLVD